MRNSVSSKMISTDHKAVSMRDKQLCFLAGKTTVAKALLRRKWGWEIFVCQILCAQIGKNFSKDQRGVFVPKQIQNGNDFNGSQSCQYA